MASDRSYPGGGVMQLLVSKLVRLVSFGAPVLAVVAVTLSGAQASAAPAAPAAPAGAEDEAPVVAELEPDELLLPQAARIEPSTGADMPTTVARRMKSRRLTRPAANSSMTWLAISPWPWRRRPSSR